MIYKAVSCKRSIDKIFGAYGTLLSQHTDRLIGEAIVWIGDCIESIGSITNLKDEIFELEVKNGRVSLPCNLHVIQSVSYKGNFLRYGSSTFNYDMHCLGSPNENIQFGTYSYTVNPNYINTNVPDGDTIFIAAKTIPVDEEGYPLVPDNYAVSECIFWYVTRQLMLGGFEHPNKQIDYEKADSNYKLYRTQAENQIEMFDIPRFESFKNSWVRLIPNTNSANTFFVKDNLPEVSTKQHYLR